MNKNWTAEQWKRAALILSLLAVLLIGVLILLFSEKGKAEIQENTGYAMGTFVSQTVYAEKNSPAAQKATDAILALESQISWRLENSDIYKLNQEAGKSSVVLSKETRQLLESALSVAKVSKGAFDPTVLPLSSLWNFDGESPQVPSQNEIAKFLPHVDYSSLVLNEQGVFLSEEGMGIDLGAAGKGAACDEALKIYEQLKVKGAVIAVGGSIGLYGEKPDGKPWRIGLRDPKGGAEDLLGELVLDGGCISTSGSYEKYIEENGKLYHHILDPRTGFPAESGLISVTVVHENGALSDILSTACFVLGLEESRSLLEEMGASAVFVDKNDQVTVIGNLDFVLKNESYMLNF